MAQSEILVETEAPPIPALEQGDHLTREEFERRFDAMPGLKKAELIEGVVHMASPVHLQHHGRPHAHVQGWLCVYEAMTPGVVIGDNVSIRLGDDNMPQPDVMLMIEAAKGGQATVSDDDYIEGGPELVVEVAASTASIDLNSKFRVYRRNNVREYIAWRVLDRTIDWFILRDGEYQRLAPGPDGIYRSEVFPGLWLDPKALVGGDMNRVFEVLQEGLADPSHGDFVARLNPAAG